MGEFLDFILVSIKTFDSFTDFNVQSLTISFPILCFRRNGCTNASTIILSQTIYISMATV